MLRPFYNAERTKLLLLSPIKAKHLRNWETVPRIKIEGLRANNEVIELAEEAVEAIIAAP